MYDLREIGYGMSVIESTDLHHGNVYVEYDEGGIDRPAGIVISMPTFPDRHVLPMGTVVNGDCVMEMFKITSTMDDDDAYRVPVVTPIDHKYNATN